MIKLWNNSQVELLKQLNPSLGENRLPDEVINSVADTINILGKHYGDKRHPEEDLGGYLCIQIEGMIKDCQEYYNLLSEYGMTTDMNEFTEPIMVHNDTNLNPEQNYQWYIQLFIISSDFTLTIIFKDK